MKTFVTADCHGNYLALKQCIERSGIDKEKDKLIVLGDCVDGFPQVKECFDELLTFRNLIFILGNHEDFALDWFNHNELCKFKEIWTKQGGDNTIKSYRGFSLYIPNSHRDLLNNAPLYYIDEKNRLFVHGGLDYRKRFELQHKEDFLWNRSIIDWARSIHINKPNKKLFDFEEIYIGHTTVQCLYKSWQNSIDILKPHNFCNLWMMDTGAGWDGVLTIMNIDTKEYWISDKGEDLYGSSQGR